MELIVLMVPEEILLKAQNTFEDTYQEFSSIEAIKARFENWKFSNRQSYEQAYCGLRYCTSLYYLTS